MVDISDAPPEFPTEEHRTSHVAALVNERKGYEAKVAGAESAGNKIAVELYKGRAAQVGEELSRLGAEAKTASARAERR